MIADYPGCDKCPLEDRPSSMGWEPRVKTTKKWMVIGEFPSATEVLKMNPYSGSSGSLLSAIFKAVGINPDEIYITNAVLCRPPAKKNPTKTAIKHCTERLRAEIQAFQPEKILCLGNAAGQALALVIGDPAPFTITRYRGLGRLIDLGENVPWSAPAYVTYSYNPTSVLKNIDLFRDLAHDIWKWKNSEGVRDTLSEFDVVVPTDPDGVIDYLEALLTASVISCDIESSGFDFLQDELFSVGFGALTEEDRGLSVIIPREMLAEERVKRFLTKFFLEYTGTVVFHNCKFDLQFLQTYLGVGFDRNLKVQDTMLLQYAADERGSGAITGRGYRTLGLKEQARTRYDIPDYHFEFEKFLDKLEEERPWNDLYYYQGIDVYITIILYHDLMKELQEEDPALIGLVEKILVPGARAFAEIERTGVPIDVEYFEKLREEFSLRLARDLQSLQERAKAWGYENFNPSSPTTVTPFLKKLGLDVRKTQREDLLFELSNLKRAKKLTPEVEKFVRDLIDYRQNSGTLSTYIEGILQRVGPDGRIRPDFLAHGADTGRLACRDPNLQNIPTLMGDFIRKGFIAPPGWVFVEVDYSQLELRVAGFLSQDPAMIQIYLDDRDIHREVAANMFKKPAAEITFHERYLAKYVDFGIIYGRGAYSLVNGWEMRYYEDELGGTPLTMREGEEFIKNFLAGFPGLQVYIQNQHDFVRKNGYVTTPTGRRRRFPLRGPEYIRSIERQAVNTPIQGFASDITFYNLSHLHFDVLDPNEAVLISTVHDSLQFLIKEDCIDTWIPKIVHEMETWTPVPMNVPLKAEAKWGPNWADAKEMEVEHEKANVT